MSKKVKSYQQFIESNSVQEEIDLKKALAGVALGSSLAFGSPQDATAKVTTPTEMSAEYSADDHSEVVEVGSGVSKAEIKRTILSQLGGMSDVRITSTAGDKIVCTVQFKSKPRNSNGVTHGNMEISVKDGRYKVDFYNVYFDYVGPQPQSAGQQIGQNVARTATAAATTALTSKIKNPYLQNMARQAANQAAMNQQQPRDKGNLTYTEAKIKNPMYASSLESEMNNIVARFKSGFSGNETQEDW